MNVGKMLDVIKDLPKDGLIVVNDQNNDWREIFSIGVSRFGDDDFEKVTVIIESGMN